MSRLEIRRTGSTRRETPVYPPAQTLGYWLGVAARQMREEAGVTMVEVAALLDMNTSKGVERFERAENFPLSLEWTLEAYGQALGRDGREIVALALELWHRRGEAPSLPPNYAGHVERTR